MVAAATKLDTSTPVLLLGGRENALAVARHLGRLGVAVRASGEAGCWAMRSRYCREAFPVPAGMPAATYWRDLLLGKATSRLRHHVVWACNDEAVEFLADHQADLQQHYLLDAAEPHLLRAMLDKSRTLEMARAVGVPTPAFWKIRSVADLDHVRDEVTFPVMVKPIHSHRFAKVFHQKLFIVESGFDELAEKIRLAHDNGIEVMVVEMIPGPDDLLSSYYTYMDSSGRCLFHFTKRVVRRYPVNRGGACYHLTEWVPATAELGRKFFGGIGYRGMGNIEFKHDERDGQLKVIEVNPRFTAAHVLAVNAGALLDLVIYAHVTGQEARSFESYQQSRRLWYPVKDFLAFRQLSSRGQLTFSAWLASVMHRHTDLPIWKLSDPLPSLFLALGAMKRVRGDADAR
jgi:predicted ATP-grasp superfamily ATP-dependent carboligase